MSKSHATGRAAILCAWLVCLGTLTGLAQAPAFTYQGQLTDGGQPANGAFDLRFILFDALIGGAQQGPIVTLEDVVVTNGGFSVTLDFGAAAFPGAPRWLEIGVRPGANVGLFTVLTPRQSVGATPYAIRSLSAANADTAANATNATNATTAVNFSGALSGDVTGTQGATQLAANAVTTAKLADGSVTNPKIVTVDGNKITGAIPLASIPAGSGNYVQNTTTPQAISNFNISGNGTIGGNLTVTSGTLSGNGVLLTNLNAANIASGILGTSRGGTGVGSTGAAGNYLRSNGAAWTSSTLLAADIPTGSGNYVQNTTTPQTTSNFNISGNGTAGGTLAGNTVNAAMQYNIGGNRVLSVAGTSNVFAGVDAGGANTTGLANSFFGREVGAANVGGINNAYFGRSAGGASTGNNNSFFGYAAGLANTSGSSNTILGVGAEVGAGNLNNATALGALAQVDCSNCLVLGAVAGVNSAATNSNVGIGTTTPTARLEIVSESNSSVHMFATSYGAINNALIGRQADGTLAAPAATTSGRTLMFFGGRGHTGAGFATVSRVGIGLEASENWTAMANGTRLTFDTTENGTTSRVERMRIDHNGRVGIGTTAPSDSGLLHVVHDSAFDGSSAIYAESSVGSYVGVWGRGTNGAHGVLGHANSGGLGIWGIEPAGGAGNAGYFQGDVEVTGTLSKGGGAFKIDHPLDPANKYLYHSFVESPDMKNIYDGNVTTDAVGVAEVILPDWFEALNRDFRYQLTVLGQFAQAIVAEKIKNNRFKIRTSLPNVEVSWQVTGIRQDAFAEKHRIPVEEVKPEKERGSYLHPAVFDQPEEKGVEWALRPEMMREMKERREQAKQPAPPPKPGSEKP